MTRFRIGTHLWDPPSAHQYLLSNRPLSTHGWRVLQRQQHLTSRSVSHPPAWSRYSRPRPSLSSVHRCFQVVCRPTRIASRSLTAACFAVLTRKKKSVGLSVWSTEVTQQYVCLPGQLSPLTEGGLWGEVVEGEALVPVCSAAGGNVRTTRHFSLTSR